MSIEVARLRADIPTDITDGLTSLFERNFPVEESEEERLRELARHSGDAFNDVLLKSEQRKLYVATDGDYVAGYAEARTEPIEGGVYELLTWIMVDSPYRGRSISTLLHQSFLADARRRAHGRRPLPTAALLSVHPDNYAKRIYEKWGYEYDGRVASDGKLHMRQPL